MSAGKHAGGRRDRRFILAVFALLGFSLAVLVLATRPSFNGPVES